MDLMAGSGSCSASATSAASATSPTWRTAPPTSKLTVRRRQGLGRVPAMLLLLLLLLLLLSSVKMEGGCVVGESEAR